MTSVAQERALRDRGAFLGATLAHVPTPALLLGGDALDHNLATMDTQFASMPSGLRPHVKAHKCPEIARRQVAAGAVGVATATVWEAIAMAEAGIADVLVANQVVGAPKVESLLSISASTRITVAVDDAGNVADLSDAAVAARRELEILVELDIGQERCGVRTREAALRLAEQVSAAPGLRLRGMQGYEGHCMLEPDPDTRGRLARAAIAQLVDAVDHLEGAGLSCEDVSAGGTGTYFITGANPRVTEVQAGSYALMDAFHGDLVPGGFRTALTVLTTVISRQGRTIVLDAGRKAIGVDFALPRVVGHDTATVRFVAEEHTLLDFPASPPLGIGDQVELVAGYGPTTVNLHEAFLVVRHGTVDDVWPIEARGR